jgi:hypothetical protein
MIALLAAGLAGCHAKSDAFYERVFPCDPGAPSDECGTTRSGEPLVCYDATPLGGQPVCTEVCRQGETEGVHDGYACLASGIRLKTCRPQGGKTDPTWACPPGLNCLRTDLFSDEGVCMSVRVCNADSDCAGGDQAKRKCAGALLKETYPTAPIFTDSLQCMQDRCQSVGGSCPPGESCLAAIAATTSDIPDICVPNCDANMHCPPNFVCSREVSGPGAPRACVPGLPGNRCTSSLDCVLGDCTDTGEGFSLCTTPCLAASWCIPLFDAVETFECVPNLDGSGKHCVSTRPFGGAPCEKPADCPPDGSFCSTYSPYGMQTGGECRLPCDSAGRCRARGGIPHVCLAGGEGGCYPGRFALPCHDSSECMTDFSCLATPEDPELGAAAGTICTIPCTSDDDCDADPYTLHDAYCSAGFCRLAAGPGQPCTRDQHCRTRMCDLAGRSGPAGTCAEGAP